MFGIEIDNDYLINEFAFTDESSPTIQKANLQDTHYNVYGYITQEMFSKPNIEQIVSYVENGYYEYVDRLGWTGKIECAITDADQRLSIFKRALAKQYIYDYMNGRSAMVNGQLTVCPDTILALNILGLLRATYNS